MNKNLSIGEMNTISGDSAASQNMQLLFAGDIIGGYKVIKQLGAGGMGEVYLVENIQMHKLYALKILPPKLSENDKFIERFRVEARVMADLKHPNIVSVHNIGHDVGLNLYYLVMEFISSENSEKSSENSEKRIENSVGCGSKCPPLSSATSEDSNPADFEELLKDKKKLPENYVLKITRQLCSALDYAHNYRGEGVIHRDLKPSNILLDVEGSAHIADFGLAKIIGVDYLKNMIGSSMELRMADGGRDDRQETEDYRLKKANMSIGDMKTIVDSGTSSTLKSSNLQHSTAAGTGSGGSTGTAGSLIGTYEYMSPEQQECGEATVKSDIYSLGLIIYRMLTGCKAKGRFKLPSKSGLDKKWDEVIEKSLSNNPEDRFSTVQEIINIIGNDNLKKKNAGRSKQFILPVLILMFVGAVIFYFNFGNKHDNNQEKKDIPILAKFEDKSIIRNEYESNKLLIKQDDDFLDDDYLKELTDNSGKTFQNSIGMDFSYIAPGFFNAGSSTGDVDEAPVHKVDIKTSFLISKYEVTQKVYEEITGSNPSTNIANNNPVENVSLSDALEFCRKLTEYDHKNKTLSVEYSYRLPTEYEWEYAASGGEDGVFCVYSGSNEADKVLWSNENSNFKSKSVGEKQPNSLGLYDMSGNLWEWCLTRYQKYPNNEGPLNKINAEKKNFVIRGGSFNFNTHTCRITNRFYAPPYTKSAYIGFRVVLKKVKKEK